MNLFSFANPWPVVAAAMGALCVLVGVQTVRLDHEKTDRALDQREFAIERANAAQAAAAEMAAYRAEEARRADAQKVIDDETRKRLATAQADAASAVVASRRLSERVAALVAAARGASANPSSPGLSAPTVDPFGMLADVLGRADQRAGLLADLADRRGAAGQACVDFYNSLTVTP
jgi:hypothetical protein